MQFIYKQENTVSDTKADPFYSGQTMLLTNLRMDNYENGCIPINSINNK
jgi:hypothetical protein